MLKQPNFFSFTNFAKQYDEWHYIKKNTNKKRHIYSQEYRPGHSNSERQLLPAQDTDR